MIQHEDYIKSLVIIEQYKKQQNTSNVKYIVTENQYWLFKKTNPDSKYFFIRSTFDNDSFIWFIGYETKSGRVARIGGDIDENVKEQLEKEFQEK